MDNMKYKGYVGKTTIVNGVYCGEVLGIDDCIFFRGNSPENALEEFKNSIDVYLDHCMETGKTPDKPLPPHYYFMENYRLATKDLLTYLQDGLIDEDEFIDNMVCHIAQFGVDAVHDSEKFVEAGDYLELYMRQ